jgi:DNA repair protein RadD
MDVLLKEKKALMVVRGKSLIHQTARRLKAEGVPCNIYQGNNTKEIGSNVTLASIDTLYSRQIVPDFDLVVIDEVHLSFGQKYNWFLESAKKQKILGVTATPFNDKGFRHVADQIIYPISIRELQAQGYLVAGRYFAVQNPDLSNVKLTAGEFNETQLAEEMTKQLSGDCIREWSERAQGRPTIVFAVNIVHSLAIKFLYNSHGIQAEHIDAETPDSERLEIFERLKSGETKVICNVGVCTTGIDIPEVSCLQIMRPTMSKALWHQMLGRATRTFPGKKDFFVLDHSSNTMRHGMIEHEVMGNLDKIDVRKSKKATVAEKLNLKTCEKCLAVFQEWPCPGCGAVPEAKPIKIDTTKKLQELTEENLDALFVKDTIRIAITHGLKPGWCFYRLQDRFGKDKANKIYKDIIKPMPAWQLRESQSTGESNPIGDW